EVTLAAVTVTALLGLRRVFDSGSFLPHVVAAALLGHLVAGACRRRRLGPVTTLAITIVAAIVVTTWTQLFETTALGVPTTATLHQAQRELSEAWRTFGQVAAPAPVLPGFVLAATLGTWLIAMT